MCVHGELFNGKGLLPMDEPSVSVSPSLGGHTFQALLRSE